MSADKKQDKNLNDIVLTILATLLTIQGS